MKPAANNAEVADLSFHSCAQIALESMDPLDVIASLPEWRHTVETAHIALARVVRRNDVVLPSAETIGEIRKIFRSSDDVLRRIGKVGRTEPAASTGNELHDADSTALRTRGRVER